MKPNPINANQFSLKDLLSQVEGQMLPGYRVFNKTIAIGDTAEWLIDGTDIWFPNAGEIPLQEVLLALNQGDVTGDWINFSNFTVGTFLKIENFPFYRIVIKNSSDISARTVFFIVFTNPFYLIHLNDYIKGMR